MKLGSVGVVSKYLTPEILEAAKQINDFFSKNKIEVYYEKHLGRRLNSKKFLNLTNPQVGLVISIGGDGTLLKTVAMLNGKGIPVVGVRRGKMGFLAEIESDLYYYLRRIVNGDYEIEDRTKLDVRLKGKKVGEVLNDAVLTTAQPGQIQRFEIEIHGDKIDEISADGIIVSTPTGSTAYAMSAGGPIMDPHVSSYEIVPICPFRLGIRSIIVPGNTKTALSVLSSKKAMLVLDGALSFSVSKGDKVEITTSKSKAHLIKFEKNFYKRVKSKLA
ncbi:TPA: NAD(+)/NADH kinase [archaeon]|nr:NAD(+)/NADH kinase [Candidatus Naiadarchaeales archaeon SRR2090153.bin461]